MLSSIPRSDMPQRNDHKVVSDKELQAYVTSRLMLIATVGRNGVEVTVKFVGQFAARRPLLQNRAFRSLPSMDDLMPCASSRVLAREDD